MKIINSCLAGRRPLKAPVEGTFVTNYGVKLMLFTVFNLTGEPLGLKNAIPPYTKR